MENSMADTLKSLAESQKTLGADISRAIQVQRRLSKQEVLTVLHCVFLQGQEFMSGDCSISELAFSNLVRFLTLVEMKSLVCLELVGWASLSLSAKQVNQFFPLEETLNQHYGSSALTTTELYLAHILKKPTSTTATQVCRFLITSIGSSTFEDLVKRMNEFIQNFYLKTKPAHETIVEVGFAALLGAYETLGLCEEKQRFLEKYSFDFQEIVQKAFILKDRLRH